MEKVLVNIGEQTYRCDLLTTDEERKKGLSNLDFLPADEGALFDFTKFDDTPQMWMKNTTIPLDMLGINEDGDVVQKYTPKPESEDLMPFPDCKYVLEVNAGSGIAIGDDFEIDDSDDLDKYVMKVLAPDGTAQMLLQGGERIFSRVSTKKLIIRAKAAFAHRNDKNLYEKDCKKLGKIVFKELLGQNTRESQYVVLPEEKKEKKKETEEESSDDNT